MRALSGETRDIGLRSRPSRQGSRHSPSALRSARDSEAPADARTAGRTALESSLRLSPILLVVILLAVSRANAGDGSEVASAPTFVVSDIDGKQHAGPLVELSSERIVLGAMEKSEISADRIVRIERQERPRSPGEAFPVLLLANGDRLGLRILSMTDDAFHAAWAAFPTLPELDVPLETVRGGVVTPAESAAARFAAERLLADRREESDILLLVRGDRLTGEIAGWKGDSLTFKGAAGEVSLKRTQVQAFGLNSSLVSFPKIEGRRQLVRLSDGSQATVRNASLQHGVVSADAAFGARVEWPLTAIASIRFLGGALKPLSELTPAVHRHTPFVAGAWPLAVNRTASGRPLTLRGVDYPLGLGTHSRSETTYDLGGRYRTFLATAGIDDETRGEGNVTFAVDVDGRRVYASPTQTGGSPALAIGPIDVSGKKRLTLIVDFGERGDVQDHADWCDPVLVEIGAAP